MSTLTNLSTDEATATQRPSFYVSLDPSLLDDRSTSTAWRAFVYLRATESDLSACVATVDVFTRARGFAALAEVDEELLAAGWRRVDEWQLGTGRGFVALLDLEPEAVATW